MASLTSEITETIKNVTTKGYAFADTSRGNVFIPAHVHLALGKPQKRETVSFRVKQGDKGLVALEPPPRSDEWQIGKTKCTSQTPNHGAITQFPSLVLSAVTVLSKGVTSTESSKLLFGPRIFQQYKTPLSWERNFATITRTRRRKLFFARVATEASVLFTWSTIILLTTTLHFLA